MEQAAEFDPTLADSVVFQRADFLWQQFGVQTMAYYGWQFGRMQTDDTKQNESGTYALHTLGENETIARLATGVKRFELPDQFNFIKLYQQIAQKTGENRLRALSQLGQIFENRRQYPKAADQWRECLKVEKRPEFQSRLDQIVGNWGRFEPMQAEPAGHKGTTEFRFRNGKSVQFTAQEIKVQQLLDDVKAYLKARPGSISWEKINIQDIGYLLVQQNQQQYVGPTVASWMLELAPRENHFDRRVTVTTPVEKAGAYLVTAKMAGGNTSRIILWLNDTVIARKPLNGKTWYFVADAVTGQPIAKANLELFGWRQENRGGRHPQRLRLESAENTDAHRGGRQVQLLLQQFAEYNRRPRPADPRLQAATAGISVARHRPNPRWPTRSPRLRPHLVQPLLRCPIPGNQGLHRHRPARLPTRSDRPIQVLDPPRAIRSVRRLPVRRSRLHPRDLRSQRTANCPTAGQDRRVRGYRRPIQAARRRAVGRLPGSPSPTKVAASSESRSTRSPNSKSPSRPHKNP